MNAVEALELIYKHPEVLKKYQTTLTASSCPANACDTCPFFSENTYCQTTTESGYNSVEADILFKLSRNYPTFNSFMQAYPEYFI